MTKAEEIKQLRVILSGLAARHEGYEHACGPCICKWHERARAVLSEEDARYDAPILLGGEGGS